MEIHEVVLIELNTRTELTIRVEVDEAEISENIYINAKIKEQEITSSIIITCLPIKNLGTNCLKSDMESSVTAHGSMLFNLE